MLRLLLVCIYLIIFVILSIVLLFTEWVIGKFNPDFKNIRCLHIVQRAFRVILFLSGVKLTVIGEENVPKDEAVLYIGNHRSFFDVIITYARVPSLTGFISKQEIEKVPILSNWMRNLYCLFLDRKDVRKGMQTILEAINYVKSGISIFIFPEGTRNDTDQPVLPFHGGSFKIAEKSDCKIIPVTLNNAENIWEAHMPWIKKTHVILEYGTPIDVSALSKEEKRELAKTVETIIYDTYVKNQSLV